MEKLSTATLKVKDVMTRKVVTVPPNCSVGEAVKIMVNKDIECLPVVEKGALKGILTFRDIITNVVYPVAHPNKVKVKDIMAKNVIICEPNSTILEVVKLMKNKKLRRVPVVNKGRLVGLVTDFDLALFGWDL